jgi:pyridoxamine 5'-phosphate oxidase
MIEWIELFRVAVERLSPIVLSLASVDAAGDPQVRSVICRRIGDDGSLWFTSDARSAKMSELLAHPHAAAVCWIPESRQQLRFRGLVNRITDPELLRQFWEATTPQTRAMFSWPEPGVSRAADSAFISTTDAVEPPDTFALLTLRPIMVEHLLLSSHPHRRRRWRLANSWCCEELNP